MVLYVILQNGLWSNFIKHSNQFIINYNEAYTLHYEDYIIYFNFLNNLIQTDTCIIEIVQHKYLIFIHIIFIH